MDKIKEESGEMQTQFNLSLCKIKAQNEVAQQN
jgi:hypothetical protein